MDDASSLLYMPLQDLDSVVDAVGSRWERLRGERLLLTGGTGFIGKWLLATFLHANRRLQLCARVLVLSRRPESFVREFPSVQDASEIEWLATDVRNLAPEVANDCGFAIHAATDVVATNTPVDILDTCTTGTKRVLDAMTAGTRTRRVLLLSSGAVYGHTPPHVSAVREDWPGAPDSLSPSSAYGEGKRVSELLCVMAAAARPGLEVAIARCFAFVGPHLPLDKHFAIGNFIRSAMRGEDVRVQGDGTPLRSYLYAADLARWLWVMLFDAPSGRAYNVGGAEILSIGALAQRVNRVLGGAGEVRIARTPDPGAPVQTYIPCIDRIATELGLTPVVELDEAIFRTAQWATRNFSS